jgi:hypothetical protein
MNPNKCHDLKKHTLMKETLHSIFNISKAIHFKEENDENLLNHFISNPCYIEKFEYSQKTSTSDLLEQVFQENCRVNSLQYLSQTIFTINTISYFHCKVIEIFHGKCLNINSTLEKSQKEWLIQLLQKNSKAFTWDYKDMQHIHPDTCIHHIYREENVNPIRNHK